MMESIKVKDPKDEKITNQDESVTNVDVNDPEKKEPTAQNKNEKELTVITDNDSQGVLADENASNKGQGPSGENL
jgi:hypothetical protein